MAIDIPTTQEKAESNLANYEAKLGQSAPINDKAFLRVQSGVEAMSFSALFKFGTERARQNLILSAGEEGLALIGAELGIDRQAATAAQLTAELPGTNGTIITVLRTFVGVLNGVRYTLANQVTIAGGVGVLALTAEDVGEAGNLDVGNTLNIDSAVPGAETVATVTVVDALGVEQEDIEVYRQKLLDAQRRRGGGGNSGDYRAWAQEVEGVKRAYPFSGRPTGDLTPSVPPERTVYVEAVESIDPDGIAPPALLDAVRDSITADPVTGQTRQPLGLTDDTLFVESISRTEFYVEIRGLDVPPANESALKDSIEDALEVFFGEIESFVEGLDPAFDRNDLVTDLRLSAAIDDVLRAFDASASGVGFGLSLGTFLGTYRLSPGELAKLAQITYG